MAKLLDPQSIPMSFYQSQKKYKTWYLNWCGQPNAFFTYHELGMLRVMYGDDLGIGCLGLAHRLKTTMPGGDRAAWYSLSVGFNMITVCFKEHKKMGWCFLFLSDLFVFFIGTVPSNFWLFQTCTSPFARWKNSSFCWHHPDSPR